MKNYTLGIDVGSASLGWAMISKNPMPGKINIISGVRIFPGGTESTSSGEQSRFKKRREARQARRQHDRKSRRRQNLKNFLKRRGLFPIDPVKELELIRLNPYKLRKKGLDQELTDHEFSRVLIHLNKRRGFKSSMKDISSDEKKEQGKIKEAITALENRIKETSSRTLGEYLANCLEKGERIREQYTRRDMFIKELDILWEKQQEFNPEKWTDDLKEKISSLIFYQRPLKSQKDLIGKCPLEPEERRCPRSLWDAHQFRILQEINNIRVLSSKEERKLKKEEKRIILSDSMKTKSITYKRIKKTLLKLDPKDTINYEESKKKGIDGNIVEIGLNRFFGDKYKENPDFYRDEVFGKSVSEEWDDFVKIAKEDYGLNEEEIKQVREIHRKPGYLNYSLKAIKKLIPFLEKGKELHEAKELAGYKDIEPDILGFIPPVQVSDYRNPVVIRALSETRKVINAIIREYGKPADVKVELARETKGSIKKRSEYNTKIKERESERKKAAGILEEHGVNPSRDNILKYLLWKECKYQCPYTGKSIMTIHQLYGDTCEVDIEHIWPRSRSNDNSFMNKTLCYRSENMRKGKKTPKEAYSGEEYDKIILRTKILPYLKRKKFKENIPDDFAEMQLRDTSYIAISVVKYLKTIGCPVSSTRGSITAELRHQWGLNSILNPIGKNKKTREDHRHHAVDAVVIALTTRSHVQNLSKEYDYNRGERFPSPLKPFSRDAFRGLVESSVNSINVSFRPERKISGQFNQDTSYGLLSDGSYVHRIPLKGITVGQIDKIRDKTIRNLVKNKYEELSKQGEKGKSILDPEKNPVTLPIKKGTKNQGHIIKKVRINEKFSKLIPISDTEGNPYRYVASGENHHISIFEWEEGGKMIRDGIVTSRFDVMQRLERNRKNKKKELPVESIITKVHPDHPEAKYIMYFCKLDMFLLDISEKNENLILCRVQKFDINQNIVFRPHTYAGKAKENMKKPLYLSKRPENIKGRKVNVDPLGRIFELND
jgi:CRISPR-associated endonuclease Csn1